MSINSGAKFEPIKKTNLSQKLVEYFIQQIKSGNFPIGEKVPNEIALANQLHVSRNILRESMKILENYGILHTVNGRGTIVSTSAIANIHSMDFFERLRNNTTVLQLLEARLIIEPQIAFHACQKCTEQAISHLVSISQKPFNTVNKQTVTCKYTDDYDFHIAISKICGNDILTEFLCTIIYRLREGNYNQFNFHIERILREKSQKEHQEIISSFIHKNPAMASKIMEQHLQDRINIIRSMYRPDFDSSQLKQELLIDAMQNKTYDE